MSRRKRPTRRLMRGETRHPGRYWTSFAIYSLIAHAVILTVLSGVVEAFLLNLPSPRLERPPLLYVGLVFSPPKPVSVKSASVPHTTDADKAPRDSGQNKAEPRPAQKPEVASPSRKQGQPEMPKPSLAGLIAPVTERPKPEKPVVRLGHKDTDVETPRKKVEKKPTVLPAARKGKAVEPDVKAKSEIEPPAIREPHEVLPQPGRTVNPKGIEIKNDAKTSPEMPVFDAENADRRFVEFFEPREGSITVIRATEKTTLAKADISGPGPVMDMEKPVVHPIAKKPSPPALEPELKNPAPLSGFSLTAAADDAKQAAEEEDPLSGPRMEPLFNFEIPGPDLASDNAKKRAEGTYPALLGIKGLPNISVERSAVRLPGDMAEFFEALVAGYHPSGSRPEPLENFTLTAAEHPIQPPPEFEVKTVRDEPAPPAFVGSWSIKGAELPEPVTRKPPKIIEVSDYTGESAEPPFLAISNPAEGDTSKGLVEVRGEALGEGIESVLFVMGGIRRELLVSEGGFSTTVALEDGRNVLNASATDRYGRTAKTRVVVNYEPLDDGPIISFIKPMDGGIIDALKIRDIDITGAVKGAGVTSVRIYLNRTITDVPLTDGRFTLRALPEVEENTLFAEATGPGGKTSRSAEIKFRVVNLFPKDIAVVMETGGADGVTQVHRWRPRPDTDAKALPAPEFTDSTTANGHFTEVETAEPGIYTIGASYELKPGETVSATFHVTLYGYDPSSKKTRDIGPFVLRGRGYIPAVRVLMPECVFWEDDYWFSGIIESSSGTTKFKEPEGIVWSEEN